jgi:protein-S-isoprenylcysteine O-methyltransferase Ste14
MGANGDGMLRAALGKAFLSAVTNLIGIVNLSSCASLPPEIYRMLAVVFLFLIIISSVKSKQAKKALSLLKSTELFSPKSNSISTLNHKTT